jgi:hypothetical protein
MTVAVNIVGWIGAAALLLAYWLVSTHRATGASTKYQALNLAGSLFVLVNSWYYGAFPSVGVNGVWLLIGVYTLMTRSTRPTPVEG